MHLQFLNHKFTHFQYRKSKMEGKSMRESWRKVGLRELYLCVYPQKGGWTLISEKQNHSFFTVLIYISPALVPLSLFWFWPMLYSLYISFTNWDYMSPTYDIVGFRNYLNLFGDPEFYRVLGNTFYFTAGTVIPTMVGGLFFAVEETTCTRPSSSPRGLRLPLPFPLYGPGFFNLKLGWPIGCSPFFIFLSWNGPVVQLGPCP